MLIRWILMIVGVLALGGIVLINWWDGKFSKISRPLKAVHESNVVNESTKPNGQNEMAISLKGSQEISRKVKKIIGEILTFKGKKDSAHINWLYDYDQYPMEGREKLIYIALGAVGLYIIGYIFYQSFIVALFLTPISLLYPNYKRKVKIELQKKQLNAEFKEALYIITSSLSVGKSLEVSIKDGVKELELLYPNNETYIIEELRYITRKVEMNETVEEAFKAFAQRSHVEDIENFSEVLIICKRTGGNLVEVMKNTSKMITEKIDFQQELDLMLSKRKFEQKFLNVIPVAMVLALSWSAPDYMAPVFETIIGRIVMTVAIVFFAISIFITKKIIKIEV